ncbi:MAG TPA: alpha-L-arabinofuranosidase C-terminal domain-containing protein, partial [Spirochaetia bacterium]|nr:alpha-L-arabinofuranosidase C-terminal domain-containing protein [Spirochaetia bacterium]
TSIDTVFRMVREAGIQARIGVTEWNVTGGWWGNDRGKLLTLETALFAGRYLNLLHRRADVVGLACRSNLTNSMASGMIQTSAAGLYLTPGYHVMRLYATHSQPVALTISDPPEGVDASACASEDGTRLTIFVVNMKADPVDMPLDLSDLGPGLAPDSAEVVCDTLDRRQPDLINHPSAPDRVRTVALTLHGNAVTLPAYSAAAIECGGDE